MSRTCQIDTANPTDVTVQDDLWSPRLETNRAVTLPYLFRMADRTGILDNFTNAAQVLAQTKAVSSAVPIAGILNSDAVVHKIVEAASYIFARTRDPALDVRLDDIIARIAAAQEQDGYLLTRRTIARLSDAASSTPPHWSRLGQDLELYIGGHLYEAAVAHAQATGKRTLLEVAVKHADLVDRLFGPDARVDVGGHPEIEPALIRLWEVTGEQRYLQLAKFFVDTRGTTAGGRERRGPFSQDHMPLTQQSEAVGQAPRAIYLYSGVTDLAALTGDTAYTQALRRLWNDVIGRKLYITGGIGSHHENEGFGAPYELPNLTAYAETCAAVSLSMWAVRMFRLLGDGQFVDVLERTLYNNFLAGSSLSGDRFFYACPPESDGDFPFNVGWMPPSHVGAHDDASATRKAWFVCACCPPNFARWLEQVPGFAYATGPDGLYVNLYIAGRAELRTAGRPVTVTQRTRYPWAGRIRIEIVPERPFEFPIHLRIPGWSRNQPLPTDLYRYVYDTYDPPVLRVNGRPIPLKIDQGFVRLERRWQSGDVIELDLPMPARFVQAHPNVVADRGKLALERGPIVYCLEGADHEGRVLDLAINPLERISAEQRPNFLGGVTVLTGRAYRTGDHDRPVPFQAIPYAVWSHRGPGEMVVWLKEHTI
jgi:hypothetical protein